MAAKSDNNTKGTAEAQLKTLIDRYGDNQKLIRAIRSAVRKLLPTTNELVYDYGTSLVISYTPSDRGIDGILSIAARDDGVRLYLTQGPKLPDPKKLLQGSAKQVRYIPVESVNRLKHPDVEALIAAAIDLAVVPLPSKGGGGLVIKETTASKKAKRA